MENAIACRARGGGNDVGLGDADDAADAVGVDLADGLVGSNVEVDPSSSDGT